MLNFSDVSIRRGPRLLFSKVNLSIFRGEKAGLTGANGTGKSTLLALVNGDVQADSGNFEMPSRLNVAWLKQDIEASDKPAIEFVMDGDAQMRATEVQIALAEQADDGNKLAHLYTDFQAIGGYEARSRAGRLMHGLGFSSADEDRPLSAFSGGWRVRIALAQSLMCRSDLLLLDEPTNHLDLDAIVWLEGWLREYRGTLLLIAHDREFLDRVVDRIVHIEHSEVKGYTGNYSAFEDQRAAQLAQQSQMYEKQQREIKHMQSFVDRFRASAAKARQAQSRMKALERMQRIAPAHVDSPFEFSFLPPEKLPRPLLDIDQQSAGYGERRVLDNINVTISPGDRIGLLGRNGAGKSTFVKLLAGVMPAMSGDRVEARDLRIGYFAQHQLEQLNVNETPIEHLLNINRRAGEQVLREFLAKFGFAGDRVFEKVGPFSGGEKARLVLAMICYVRPNLMLLDEPTNHLDLEMRQALAVALNDYEGAVVLVSHDRHLMRTVADTLILVDSGEAKEFDGDLEDYAKWLGESAGEKKTSALTAKEANSGARKQKKQNDARKRDSSTPLQDQLKRCEEQLQKLTSQRKDLETKLARPDLYEEKSKAKLRELLDQQATLLKELHKVESEWLEASEKLEAAN
jgi:ATP-binding cassette subfamily F protein 3